MEEPARVRRRAPEPARRILWERRAAPGTRARLPARAQRELQGPAGCRTRRAAVRRTAAPRAARVTTAASRAAAVRVLSSRRVRPRATPARAARASSSAVRNASARDARLECEAWNADVRQLAPAR